jgi:hypothetical protein
MFFGFPETDQPMIYLFDERNNQKWERRKARQFQRKESEEIRVALWWNKQMHHVFGSRTDKASTYKINLNEDYNEFPEYFDDPSTVDQIESWVCEHLLTPKYPPAQVATLWRQMEFTFSEYYEMPLSPEGCWSNGRL